MVELVLLIVGGGVALIFLARIAKRRGDLLRESGVTPRTVLEAKNAAQLVQLTFLGPQPKLIDTVGRILAVGVILFVSIFVVVVIVAIALAPVQP